MAITYPLAKPIYNPTRVTFSLKNSNLISKSPFTFSGQVQDWGGQQLTASVQVDAVTREQGEYWISYLTSLRGHVGTFLLGDPSATRPMGSVTGSPTVDGAHAIGDKELKVANLPVSTTGVYKAGDWVQISGSSTRKLHKVLRDVNSDATGKATLDIWPNTRSTYMDNTPIYHNNTAGVFRLSSPNFDYSVENNCKYTFNFNCEEVL